MESNTQKGKRIKKDESKKIYEDVRWLIVSPFTLEAVRLYGSNTKWCFNGKYKIHARLFEGYITSGVPYFIIDKSKSSREDKYRKVGLQKNWDTKEVWIDATNTHLTPKEISSFKDRLNPAILESIYDDWNYLKPTYIEKIHLNPIAIIKNYSNNNLTKYFFKVLVKYDTTPRLLFLLLFINFLISFPALALLFLFKRIW